LELANETIQTRLSSAETKHSSLLRTFEEQSRRLADAHANIANLTSNAASQKMSYRREFDRLMEEIRLLERRSDEARAAVADREAELERHSEDMAERERMWEERVEREEKGRKIAEKRADDLKVTLQQLTSSAGDGSIDVSRAASLASSQRASGKSYTQFYTDFIKSEQDLQEKEQEVQRLTALVEEISQDIVEQVG
jgi:nucleoprotein TPR